MFILLIGKETTLCNRATEDHSTFTTFIIVPQLTPFLHLEVNTFLFSLDLYHQLSKTGLLLT